MLARLYQYWSRYCGWHVEKLVSRVSERRMGRAKRTLGNHFRKGVIIVRSRLNSFWPICTPVNGLSGNTRISQGGIISSSPTFCVFAFVIVARSWGSGKLTSRGFGWELHAQHELHTFQFLSAQINGPYQVDSFLFLYIIPPRCWARGVRVHWWIWCALKWQRIDRWQVPVK